MQDKFLLCVCRYLVTFVENEILGDCICKGPIVFANNYLMIVWGFAVHFRGKYILLFLDLAENLLRKACSELSVIS